MVEYIIGNFLVDSGKISKDQLQKVLEELKYADADIDTIAISDGMLTREQADEIKAIQLSKDMAFEDIAVEEGYITYDQLVSLIAKQGDTYMIFIQILQDKGLVTADELDFLLNDFKNSNGFREHEFEDFKTDEIDKIVPLLLPREGRRYKDLICTAVRTIIRQVDRHVYIGRAAMVDMLPPDLYVCQSVSWDGGIVDFFSERDGALLVLSSKYGKTAFDKIDEESLDSAGEFLNCINGMYISSQSRDGVFYDLRPPVQNNCEEQVNLKTLCRVPVFIGEKGLYFTIASLV